MSFKDASRNEIESPTIGSIDMEKNTNNSNKKPKNRQSFSLVKAALSMFKDRSSHKPKQTTKSTQDSNGNWKKFVGSIRPLHLQDDDENDHDRSLPPPSPPPPEVMSPCASPTPSYISGGAMSQYASATNLCELDNSVETKLKEEDDDDQSPPPPPPPPPFPSIFHFYKENFSPRACASPTMSQYASVTDLCELDNPVETKLKEEDGDDQSSPPPPLPPPFPSIFHFYEENFSPRVCASSTMSQYASATNLCELDNPIETGLKEDDDDQQPPPPPPPPPFPSSSHFQEEIITPRVCASPTLSYLSVCAMSQYASATNLFELNSPVEIEVSEDDPDEVFDALTGDEMIDAKAEQFITKFYEQMRLQNGPSWYLLDRDRASRVDLN